MESSQQEKQKCKFGRTSFEGYSCRSICEVPLRTPCVFHNRYTIERANFYCPSNIDLSSGPTVKIFLGSGNGSKQQALIVPKTLLCARSAFFNHAFNGNGNDNGNDNAKESLPLPQELHLPETPLTVFQLIIQFLSTNSFTFPTSIASPSEKQTLYLHFFTCCHEFSIQNLTPIISLFKTHLKNSSVRGEFPSRVHIQNALSLPRSHEARKLCIAACVKPYACSITKSSTCYGRALFHLEGLMEESDEFAAELVRGYTKAVRGALGTHTIVDPLTSAPYTITTGVACLVERSRGSRCASHLEEF
ncbi:hypothetical protein OCU04_000793 [Sclerotinia nivalis]|uniref:BTB domain-containing protein n=1 Tax=Sclerotinia nivalis TaxID=352851 RepID=A0A9X0AXG7_9HELO|nr:hypothetical protein OCU04_000793 [Sclerotinia nivalis]